MKNEQCLCESGKSYADCCQPLHMGSSAIDAASLMRSRYSAYVLHLEGYLLQSWHPDTRPVSMDLSQDKTKWLGLKVMHQRHIDEDTATVEFIARYKISGKAERLHEISRFKKIAGTWYYLNGEFV